MPEVPAETFDLAIDAVALVDAVSERRDARTLYVRDGRIARIEPATAPRLPAARRVDGSGRVLIPGLWDMHVHVIYEPELTATMADLFLDYGITSVRDTGGLLEPLVPVVERWRSADVAAPHIYFSGPLLDGSVVVYDGDDRPEIGIGNGDIERAWANFARLQDAGVDFIKIYELVAPEVFAELTALADAAGLPIAAHVPLSMTADVAGPRVDSMEHLRNIELACSDEATALLTDRRARIAGAGPGGGYALRSALHAEQRPRALASLQVDSPRCQQVIQALRNTIQVPTMRLNTIGGYSPLARADWREALAQLPESVSARWLERAEYFAGLMAARATDTVDWNFALVRALDAADVPIGAGTDTPIAQAIPGYSLHTELERMVDAGLSPRTALAAATLRPAEFFDLRDRMGELVVGQQADLVLLDADPLEDIRNTRAIALVVLAGEVVRDLTLR
ncbi:MAG: amidohydrolase family protein [Pseudomonadota bacterium]